MNKLNTTILLVFLSLFTTVFAQQGRFVGHWEGKLDAGIQKLTLIFHVRENGGVLTATMDSPDQKATGIPCQKIIINGDSVTIDMANLGIQFKGVLEDSLRLDGHFFQGGMDFPLLLTKTEHPTNTSKVETVVPHPQTPKPPFGYYSKEVVYKATLPSGLAIQYGATITMPDSAGHFPAVLLITGSGPQNRDGEIFGHKPFAVIADYLTKQGYLVMRVDDRGKGKTTGIFKNATTADFAQDVRNSLHYMRGLPQVDQKKVGLLGHSEGGIIAPMVAAEDHGIDFIILMAGPGIKIGKLMTLQNAAVNKTVPGDDSTRFYDSIKYAAIIDAALNYKDTAVVRHHIDLAVRKWINSFPATSPLHKNFSNEAVVKKMDDTYFNAFVVDPWFSYFLHLDPAVYLKKLHCKVLALNGTRDIQVIADPNLAGIKKALQQSGSPSFEVLKLEGLNHLFQKCQTCSVAEYGKLEQTIDPNALETIGAWLKKNVTGQK